MGKRYFWPASLPLNPQIVFGLALLILAWLVYGALLSASFHSDDWTFLSLAKHGDGPLGFFAYDHSFTYMYRPLAMDSWWLLTRGFDVNPAAHYGFAILLHWFNALLVALIALRWGASSAWAWLLAALFLVHPATGATVSWLADRFDLLMSCGVLLAIWASARWRDDAKRGWVLAFAAAVLAVGSKETGLAVLLLLAIALFGAGFERKKQLTALLILFGLAVLYFAARAFVLGSLGGVAAEGSALEPVVKGTGLWWVLLPHVLSGAAGAEMWSWALLLLLPLLAWALWRYWRERWVLLQLCALLGALAVLQAPVTSVILAQEAPFHSSVNYRFYYLALAASLLLVGLGMAWLRQAYLRHALVSVGAFVLTLGLLGHWTWQSRAAAQLWVAQTAQPQRLELVEAAAELARALPQQVGEACLVRLHGAAQLHPDFSGYADLLVKAQLPPGHPALDCVFATEVMPWKLLTHWQSYADGRLGIPPGRAYSFRSGSLAVHAKTSADADEWQWMGYDYRDMHFRR